MEDSKATLKEYNFDAVKKAALHVFGPDPSIKDSPDFDDLLEQFDDEMAEEVLDELDERPY